MDKHDLQKYAYKQYIYHKIVGTLYERQKHLHNLSIEWKNSDSTCSLKEFILQSKYVQTLVMPFSEFIHTLYKNPNFALRTFTLGELRLWCSDTGLDYGTLVKIKQNQFQFC